MRQNSILKIYSFSKKINDVINNAKVWELIYDKCHTVLNYARNKFIACDGKNLLILYSNS